MRKSRYTEEQVVGIRAAQPIIPDSGEPLQETLILVNHRSEYIRSRPHPQPNGGLPMMSPRRPAHPANTFNIPNTKS